MEQDPSAFTKAAVRILVVEDSPTQREQLRFLFEEAGYEVATASDGAEGLATAQAERDEPFGLIVSDIVMPRMDGYGLSKALRADPALRTIPIVLLTSLGDPRDVIRGLESGATNFVRKPYDGRYLLSRVQNVLMNEELRRGSHTEMGINIFFAGQQFFITSDRLQILDLLLSTYESAVRDNAELLDARDDLRKLNDELERRVSERTAALAAEVEERKRAQAALSASHDLLRSVLESVPIRVFWKDGASRFLGCNTAFARDGGMERPEEIVGKDDSQMSWREQAAAYRADDLRVMESDEPLIGYEEPQTTPDGITIWLKTSKVPLHDAEGRVCGLLGVYDDITDVKRAEEERHTLEEQLRASQKMEAIGSLAGGIAHDFNNLLSVILSYAEFAVEALRDGDPIRDDLLEVRKAGERATALTRQLLAFSRKQVLQPELIELNRIATGLEKMLRRILGEDIDLVQRLAPELGVTVADPGQIEQVLMNLVVNARDAMPNGGKLTIETDNVEVDEAHAARRPDIRPGSFVRLAVTDTGCGMDAETRARIFEPFFTTKGKGKGTGLGLSTAYGIIKQSGGHIWVYSEPGQGTTFSVYLPREAGGTMPAPGSREIAPAAHGDETILLVEDEDAVRELARRILDGSGYAVLTAANGGEALLACERHAGPIHLVLTDVVMPLMSGRALADRLARVRPEARVLYMSGYTDNAIVHHGRLDAGTHFIGKPFNATDLARKVREVLDAAPVDAEVR